MGAMGQDGRSRRQVAPFGIVVDASDLNRADIQSLESWIYDREVNGQIDK